MKNQKPSKQSRRHLVLIPTFLGCLMTMATSGWSDVLAQANDSRPNGKIDSPAMNMVIPVGGSVNFSGSGTDPGGDSNLSFAWDFNGDGQIDSTEQDPGNITFDTEGIFNVSLTVTDSEGLADLTPATVTITVGDPAAPPVVVDALGVSTLPPPARSVSTVIATICPRGNLAADLQRDCNQVVGASFAEDPAVTSALLEITPDAASAPTDASQTSATTQVRNVGSRLIALRRGVRMSAAGLTFNIDGQTLSGEQLAKLYNAMGGQTGGAASADDGINLGPIGIFVNGTITLGDKDATVNESGFDFDTKGITVGADYRLNDNFVAGGAFGYTNTDLDLDNNGGELDTDGYSIILYSTYYHADQFYIDGLVSYGSNDYDQNRNIRYNLTDTDPTTPGMQQPVTVDQELSADYDGDQWNISIGAGYDFNRGGFTFGPLGRLEYLEAEVDSYRETASNTAPGSGWTVAMDSQEFESLTLSLGGQASYAISQTWGVLVPQLRLEWVHEFEDDPLLISGRFVGDPNNKSFRFLTDPEDQNYFNLGVGASAVFAQGRSAFIQYEGIFGFDDLEHHSVNLGVRLEF